MVLRSGAMLLQEGIDFAGRHVTLHSGGSIAQIRVDEGPELAAEISGPTELRKLQELRFRCCLSEAP